MSDSWLADRFAQREPEWQQLKSWRYWDRVKRVRLLVPLPDALLRKTESETVTPETAPDLFHWIEGVRHGSHSMKADNGSTYPLGSLTSFQVKT